MSYVSITGLRLKGFHTAPIFWWHTLRSLRQAREADVILHVDARVISGVHHTLTAWISRQAMTDFMRTGAHLSAMRSYPKVGQGRTVGFDASSVPDWQAARQFWEEHAKEPAMHHK